MVSVSYIKGKENIDSKNKSMCKEKRKGRKDDTGYSEGTTILM